MTFTLIKRDGKVRSEHEDSTGYEDFRALSDLSNCSQGTFNVKDRQSTEPKANLAKITSDVICNWWQVPQRCSTPFGYISLGSRHRFTESTTVESTSLRHMFALKLLNYLVRGTRASRLLELAPHLPCQLTYDRGLQQSDTTRGSIYL